ncbi:MAG: Gfo/Idh/MocA family oxidoreductase [Kiritimatiellae bacterium]|nr:Gfo/Idh/MocA family oxidoreductase [Kiritimatiellia bacterium]
MKRIRWAVVGCGMLAQKQHIPNVAKSERMTLQVCCDLSDEALRLCRDEFGAREVVTDYRKAVARPDVDAICLATTEKLRLPVIEAAAEAGKPVYCEKPLARTLEEMYRIRDVVQRAGIPFCVGHNRRSAPAMLEAHALFRAHMENPKPCPWRFDREGAARPRLAEDGRAAISVRINDDWHSWKAWVFDKQQAPHGPMLFEMTHFTDICNWFLAAEPVEVTAIEQGMLNHGVLVRYGTGELASLLMCGNGTFGYPKELYEAFGNGGAVVVDHMLEIRTAGLEGAPAVKTFPMLHDRHPAIGTEGGLAGWLKKKQAACREAAAASDPSRIFTAEPDKGHAHALERFADQIEGRGPVVCGVEDAVTATRVAFAAIRSAAERRTIPLSEV